MTPDALLVVGFGGPEGPDEVLPFLRRVTAGRGIPDERLVEVGAHYEHFGGVSPINEFHRRLLRDLTPSVQQRWPGTAVYWANRNSEPYLPDVVEQMTRDGVSAPVALVTSAYSSYSGCRQYRENLETARRLVSGSPPIPKVRPYFDHPALVDLWEELIAADVAAIGGDPASTLILFSTHSIPTAAAHRAGPGGTDAYERQHQELGEVLLGRLRERFGSALSGDLCYQSRSGPPSQPWLEPDVSDRLRQARAGGITHVVLVPLGFISDHIEVLWDLDTVALADAAQEGLVARRTPTVGEHPAFAEAVLEILAEYFEAAPARACTRAGPTPSVCPADCCLPAPRPARPS